MCGIVGYIGKHNAAPILLEGLSKLEYRGYDSAGIAVYNGSEIQVEKAKGRLQVLSDKTNGGKDVKGTGQLTANRQMLMLIRTFHSRADLLLYITELLRIIYL